LQTKTGSWHGVVVLLHPDTVDITIDSSFLSLGRGERMLMSELAWKIAILLLLRHHLAQEP
jgi:hypothetical protein